MPTFHPDHNGECTHCDEPGDAHLCPPDQAFSGDDVRAIIEIEVRRAGSGDALAKRYGVSGPYLSMVRSGRKGFGRKILTALKLETTAFYISSRPQPKRKVKR
jgi:hypothetical protein